MWNRKTKEKKERIVEIDFIRGVLILFMVVDHLFYDFAFLVPQFFPTFNGSIIATASWYWSWNVRVIFRFVVLSTFFLISGISSYFSRNNLKRGIILFIVGLLYNLVFFVIGYVSKDSGMYVFFGPISCFSVSILIFTLLSFLLNKFAPKYKDEFKWIYLSFGVAIVSIGVVFKVWSIGGPECVYKIDANNFMLVILGARQHMGADWLPLCPYMGLLFIGVTLGEMFYKDKKSYFKKFKNKEEYPKPLYYGLILPYKSVKNVITFSGHYSLFYYILHQPILILIIFATLMGLGFPLNI